MNPRKLGAEFLGTLRLVLGGCGTAVLAGKAMGTLGIAFAFGLTVLTGAYALGPISGGHFNPAVTIGLWLAKKFPTGDVLGYIIAQCLGAIGGAAIIAVIANGKPGFDLKSSGFAANGFGKHSPDGYKAGAAFVCELVLTGIFVLIILGATHGRATTAAAPIAIGLSLTLIHLISIPVTNTSVNPARSLSQAVFVGDWALKQLWLFWVAPIAGAIIGALLWSALWDADDPGVTVATTT
jgi:aquaporin Z